MNVSPVQNQNPGFGQLNLLMTKEKLASLPTHRMEKFNRIKSELSGIKDFHLIVDAKGRCAVSMPNGKIYRYRGQDSGKQFTECEKNGSEVIDKRYMCLERDYEELMEPVCIKEPKLLKKWGKIVKLFKTNVYEGYAEFVKLLAYNYNIAHSTSSFEQFKFLVKEKLNGIIPSQQTVKPDKPATELSDIEEFQLIVDSKGQYAFSMPDGKIYRFRNSEDGKHFTECEKIGSVVADKGFVCLEKNYDELMKPLCLDEETLSVQWARILNLFKTNPSEGYSEFIKLLDQNYKMANSYQGLTMRRRLIKSLEEVREEPSESVNTPAREEQFERDFAAYLRELDKRWHGDQD